MRFGIFYEHQLPRPWAPDSEHRLLQDSLDQIELADRLGYDYAWEVEHHFLEEYSHSSAPEVFLGAASQRTTRIRLGVLVSSNTFRHPALLLKEAVTVDHISDGRLILGIGTGWNEDEHRRYGIDLPEPRERVDRFEEAIQVISLLMSRERTTFTGRFFRLDDARLEPPPVQRPRIPILIAAHRPRMLRIAARYADQWDTFAAIPGTATAGVEAELGERIAQLDAACREVGRDPAEIRRSTWATNEVLRSVDAYREFVGRHARLGFTDFTTVLPAAEDEVVLRSVAQDVIPEIRARGALD